MIFYSPHANMQFLTARPRLPEFNKITGEEIRELTKKRLDVNFGILGEEFEYVDQVTGEMRRGADVRGHFFDTVVAQQREGWTDEEREQVERFLLMKCDTVPEFIRLHSAPPAAAPWPTYDQMTNYLKIGDLAETLGLLTETLVYERQNKNRDGVIAELEKRQASAQADQDLVAA